MLYLSSCYAPIASLQVNSKTLYTCEVSTLAGFGSIICKPLNYLCNDVKAVFVATFLFLTDAVESTEVCQLTKLSVIIVTSCEASPSCIVIVKPVNPHTTLQCSAFKETKMATGEGVNMISMLTCIYT